MLYVNVNSIFHTESIKNTYVTVIALILPYRQKNLRRIFILTNTACVQGLYSLNTGKKGDEKVRLVTNRTREL